MPISDPDERESSQADAGLLEYIDRRRLYQVRQRRHRILLGTTVALGVLVAALVVSNVILLNRLNSPSEAPPPASVASAPSEAPQAVAPAPQPAAPMPQPTAPAPQPTAPAAPPAVEAPQPAAPAAQAPIQAPVPAPQAAARAPEPVAAPEPAAPPPAPASAPAASTRSTPTRGPTGVPPLAASATSETDSARRTARWLVQTHGRIEAEIRAAKVAEFYSGEQGAFWQRVLLNVRQEPER